MVNDEPCCALIRHVGGWRRPCTDEWHAWQHERLINAMRSRTAERAAALTGHAGTIRFTADTAYFECSCGARTPTRSHSGAARIEGLGHLERVGTSVLVRIRDCRPAPNPAYGQPTWECEGARPAQRCVRGRLFGPDDRYTGLCDCPCNHDGGAL